MAHRYLLGVFLAILSGALIQSGLLLQKNVVNGIPKQARDKHFMRTLIKSPLWVTGFLLEIGGGSATFMLAQQMIGPALVPGLMASGLIVLALGSVKFMGEDLNGSEILGIGLMILGILLLGLSELDIGTPFVREALVVSRTLFRITLFSLVLFVLWAGIHWAAIRSPTRKGTIMAFSNGFPFCLSNFWVSPLLAVIFPVLTGKGTWAEAVVFVLASLILVSTNLVGIRQTQEVFKYAQASNAIPVQQVPVQVTPVLVYFYVFSLSPPRALSAFYIVSGALLIITSGFLLGRRQTPAEE